MANVDVNEAVVQLLALASSNPSSGLSQNAISGLLPTSGLEGGSATNTGSTAGQILQSSVGGIIGLKETSDAETKLVRQLADLTNVALLQTESMETNTSAVIENSLAVSSEGGRSKAASVANTALSFLGGGFGLVQLLGKLIGGTDEEPVSSPSKYSLPDPVQMDLGLVSSASLLQPLRYGQDGLARAQSQGTGAGPEVTIQVQAIDSRSFLDHSEEIAQAVKVALLNSHSLNDVVAEL